MKNIKSLVLSALVAGSFLASGVPSIAAPIAQQGRVTKAQATAAVKAQLPNGKILSSEYEKESGHEIWSFDVRDAGALKEIWVDAKTGLIIQNTTESKADQKKETRMDKAEAMVKHKTKGEVIGSTDEGKGKSEVYDFEVQMKDGSKQHVRVNARTMRIVK